MLYVVRSTPVVALMPFGTYYLLRKGLQVGLSSLRVRMEQVFNMQGMILLEGDYTNINLDRAFHSLKGLFKSPGFAVKSFHIQATSLGAMGYCQLGYQFTALSFSYSLFSTDPNVYFCLSPSNNKFARG